MMEFYRRHPIATWVFGIGAALVVIWALFSRSSVSGESGVQYVQSTGGPSPDAALAASTQLEAARISASSDARREDNQLQLAAAQLGFQRYATELAAATSDRQSERDYNVNVYSIASGERVSLEGLRQSTEQLSIQAGVATALAREEEETTRAQIEANTQQTLAITNANVAQNLAVVNAQTSQQANALASQQKQQKTGILGGLLGGVMKIFSDDRLKSDIRFEGVNAAGMNVYSYVYTAQARRLQPTLPRGRTRGVMARELIGTKWADAVGVDRGFYTVDYSRLQGVSA